MGSAPGWRPTAGLERQAATHAALLLNHILGDEPIATQRLKAHAGRSIDLRFRAWQRLLPGRLALEVTRAGLLEQRDDRSLDADLCVAIDLDAAACALLPSAASAQPFVEAKGDQALAADVVWLLESVRWEPGADLERFAGPAAAAAVERTAAAAAMGLRRTLRAIVGPRPR